jgi:Putative transposase/Transposase zinc-binding domain
MVCAISYKKRRSTFKTDTWEDGMGLLTLQDIFCLGYPEYERTHPLPTHIRKAACAIMQCRTAALGGHIQACLDGHMARIWSNACRHRSCPQCAYLQTERWLVLQQARLLACDHYHVIFTLPHDLNPLWLANVPVMSTLLFQAVRDTLCTLLGDPKYLGAQPGIIAALHTWSQTLVLHPHVHCLVTGGGLSPAGSWVAVRHGFLLPARVVMAVFRGKMLDALRQAWAHGELALPAALRPQQLVNLLNRLGHPAKTRWNVRIMARYRHGAGGVTYLARYLRGGPIKNARLVACAGGYVTFLHRARHEEAAAGPGSPQRMTLPLADFLRRWLLHVPVPNTRVVRSYGLYHHTHAEALAVCRAVLGQPPVEVPAGLDWQTVCAHWGDASPERCPTCGQVLVCTGVIPRGGAPPLALAEEHAA